MLRPLTLITLTALLLSACNATPTQNIKQPTTVSQIDLDDYLGKWYEIGRLPMYFQEKCTSDVTATYSLKENGKINVLNACTTKDGHASVNGEAYATDDSNAKLRVSFLPSVLKSLPIGKANYWVLASDKNEQGYRSALVGTPNHKYLWILSRTPTLDEATYERYLDIAKQNGYDLQEFKRTKHNP